MTASDRRTGAGGSRWRSRRRSAQAERGTDQRDVHPPKAAPDTAPARRSAAARAGGGRGERPSAHRGQRRRGSGSRAREVARGGSRPERTRRRARPASAARAQTISPRSRRANAQDRSESSRRAGRDPADEVDGRRRTPRAMPTRGRAGAPAPQRARGRAHFWKKRNEIDGGRAQREEIARPKRPRAVFCRRRRRGRRARESRRRSRTCRRSSACPPGSNSGLGAGPLPHELGVQARRPRCSGRRRARRRGNRRPASRRR